MDYKEEAKTPEKGDDLGWEPPRILEKGKVEAKLFSDEPDPWGP